MRRLAPLATTLLLAVAACALRGGGPSGAEGRVRGRVTHRQRIALPPDAVVEVALIEVSRPGAPARVVATERVRTEGRQVPVPFDLVYDPAKVDPAGRHALRAAVVVGTDVLLESAEAVPVLTAGQPAGELEVVVAPRRPTARAQRRRARPGPASLEGTHWRLVELHGKPIGGGAAGREPHVTLAASERRFAGSGGCNRLVGVYVVAGSELRFGEVGTTYMACPTGMEQERTFVKALEATTGFEIDGNTLALLDGRRVVARFEAR